MELKDYTLDELRAELKRRIELKKAQKAQEMKAALRCRNCVHCVPHPKFPTLYHQCAIRTYGKTFKRNYGVKLSTKACDLFKRKPM